MHDGEGQLQIDRDLGAVHRPVSLLAAAIQHWPCLAIFLSPCKENKYVLTIIICCGLTLVSRKLEGEVRTLDFI